MSHIIIITLAVVSIAVTTCRALPDIHKHMSAQQLQSIFHVDDHDAVPQYEVIQLLHHHNEEASGQQYNNYRRRKRSIETVSLSSTAPGSHHVKKDLSKTPYSSEAKSGSIKANSLDDNVNNKPHKAVKHIKQHKVQVRAFGEKLNLTLKKTQGLFKKGELHKLPMWFMDNEANATHGVNLEKIEDEHSHSSDKIGEVFQDEENMAAILMRRHEITGDLIMEGSIGHDMVIKPLPHELSPSAEESHHVIFKRSADPLEHLSDFAYMEPDDLATHDKLEKLQERRKRSAHRTTLTDLEEEQEELEAEDNIDTDESSPHRRAKRQAPYMIYPEILVIVDYDGYRLHGGDNLQVKRYFIAFWNGVDLRYRLLKEPRIRVSIAGIIISRGRDATPYLERNRVGRDAIDSAAALTDMGKYLFRERRLPVYDIAVAITKYDMCRRRKGGRCTKGTAGFAYVGGACVVNRRLEKVNSVAIIEDTGGFSGIIVAAHEVGHLLGAVHDGSPPPSYLGGPGAQRCRWEDGFIMSDLRHTERGFRWSACSVQSFQHFLNGATATCLYNVPHEDNALGRSLPGTLLSLDAQCRRDRGTYACFKDERVCAQLFCFDAQTGYCVAYRPAAEGSACGNSLHCLDGRCTPLQVASNLIPNYGAQYRLGYKSNEAIVADDNENKMKELQNDAANEEEEDDTEDDDDDQEDEDDRQEHETQEQENTYSSEEEEDEEEEEGDEVEDKEENPAEDEQEEESEENTSDSSDSTENDSSPTPNNNNGENDDDEEYLTEDNNNPSPKDLNNHLDKTQDNNYEETMVKHKDNENSSNELNLQNLGQRPLLNMNTYQYLSQLWQKLQTYTTTTTTKNPLTVLHKQLYREPQQSRRNATTSARNTIQHYTDMITTAKPRTLHTTLSPTPPPPTSTFIKTLSKQFQYYMKLLQANTDSNSRHRNSRTTINKPYYNSHTILPSKPYSNSLNNANTKHSHSHIKSNNNANNADDEGDNVDDNGDDGDDDDDDDSGDNNDESNETIEKQKRKLTIPIGTTMQQQLQASPPTSHAATVTTNTLDTAAPATTPPSPSPLQYGIRSASLSSPTFFDTYVKKLQALNAAATSTATTEATVLRATAEDFKTLDKTEKTPYATSQFEGQYLKRTLSSTPTLSSFSSISNKNPYTKQIKSTAATSTATTNGSGSSSSSSSSSSSYKYIPQPLKIVQETDTANIQQHRQQTPQTSPAYVTNYIGDNTNRLASIVQQHQPQSQQQQQKALAKLLQQTNNSHQQHPTSLPPPSGSAKQQQQKHQHQQQQQQQSVVVAFSSSTTTRRPKIKTQKLIRRLRTHNK